MKNIKKVISFVLSFSLMLLIFPVFTLTAYALDDDYAYTVSDEKATITEYNGDDSIVVIPSALGGYPVTEIGYQAFQDCQGITSLTVPSSVLVIGAYAFSGCYGITDLTMENGVTEIRDSAFSACTGLKSLTIPASVNTIGDDAFWNCRSITSLTIPGNVETIGKEAFTACEGLTSLTINDGVTQIGDSAFSSCSNIKSVTLPASVTSLGYGLFSSCWELTDIVVDPGNTTYSNDVNGVLFDDEKKDLLQYPAGNTRTGYIIPDTVTTISTMAFEDCSKITEVTIPGSVTEIGEKAFSGCNNLLSLTLPDSVIDIGASAFEGCGKIPSLTLPANVTTIAEKTFSGCYGIKSLTLPDSLVYIKNSAFAYCEGLTSVTIPGSVTEIDEDAFAYCDGLTGVTLPASVTVIEEGAFSGCENLQEITVDPLNTIYANYNGDGVLYKGTAELVQYPAGNARASYTLPDTVTTIGSHAFSQSLQSKLTTLTIPASVTTIEDWAFDIAFRLSTIHVDSSNADYSSADGVLFNKDQTVLIQYPIGNARTSYTLPAGVESIYKGAFALCQTLTSVTLPDSVTAIGSIAFMDCHSLSRIIFQGDAPGTFEYGTFMHVASDFKILYPLGKADWTTPTWCGYFSAPYEYLVSYNSQGGSFVPCSPALSGKTIPAPANPSRTGYTFDGWYKEAACTNVWTFSTDKVTKTMTLYAKWLTPQYTITAQPNNAAYGSVTGSGKYYGGTTVTLKAVPKAGYRFVRWLEGSTQASANYEYKFASAKNRTLKAEFAAIGKPTLSSSVSAGYNSIKLTWTAVTGAKGYEVWRATSANGTYVKIKPVAGQTTFTDTSLTTGKTYYYKIKAYCAAGTVTTYGALSAYKYTKPIPATPAITAITAASKSLKLSWKAITGAGGYEIYRATSAKGKYTKIYTIKSGKATSYTNTGLAAKKTYYYKLRAFRKVGSATVYSNYSAYKYGKTK
jgi:uncharacterized repeat protein (TIGR02543 family)